MFLEANLFLGDILGSSMQMSGLLQLKNIFYLFVQHLTNQLKHRLCFYNFKLPSSVPDGNLTELALGGFRRFFLLQDKGKE